MFKLKAILSSFAFMLANSLAITSLSTTSWVVNSFAGETRLGLTKLCVTFKNQGEDKEVCEALQLPSHWAVTVVFIVIGICLSFLTILLLLLPMWESDSKKMGRIIGFMSMAFFGVAAVVFPFGFSIKEIGGEPYKLPENVSVGYSYYFFCGSILLLTVAVVLSNFIVDPQERRQ